MSDATAAETPAVNEEDVLRQLEFYFCDVAYPFDEFLQSKADAAGSIAADIIAGSPRMITLCASLDGAARAALLLVVAARSDSVVVVGADRLARRYPLPKDDATATRSVYLSGLPKDKDDDALRALLLQPSASAEWAPVVSVRRQRDLKAGRAFSGQVFVECESEEKAAALLRYASRGGFDCRKAKLLSDFFESQASSILEQKQKRKSGGGGGGGGGPSVAVGAKRGRDAAAADDGRPAPERGCVLKFEGVGAAATREAIAALAAKHGDVAFTEFWPGKTDGFVRYKAAASATAALAAITTEDVGGAVPTWRLLAPEEEEAYRAGNKQRRRGGGGGGRGRGRGRGGGRRPGRGFE